MVSYLSSIKIANRFVLFFVYILYKSLLLTLNHISPNTCVATWARPDWGYAGWGGRMIRLYENVMIK